LAFKAKICIPLKAHIYGEQSILYGTMIKLNWHIFWPYLFHLVHIPISYSSCAKAKTNVLPWVLLMLVLDWKGNGVFGKDNASTQLHRYYLPFVGIPQYSPIDIIFHSYLFYQWGRNCNIGLSKSLFLAINAKGEKVSSPKKKDRTTTNFKIFKNFSNRYLNVFDHVQMVFTKKLVKPSWTLRGEFYSGGVLFSQRKSIQNRGENFKSWKCFLQSYSYAFDYLQKKTLKIISKRICKNKTSGANMVQNVK
jgi:hypothetical protein